MKMRHSMGCDDWRGDWARERIWARRNERDRRNRLGAFGVMLKAAVLPPYVEFQLREARDAV